LCHLVSAQNLSFSSLTTSDGLPDDIVNDVFKDSYGNFWIGTKNGLAFFDGVNLNGFSDTLVKSAHVSSVEEDDDGNIYIGTYYQGVIKYVRDSALFRPFYSFDNHYSVSKVVCRADTVAIASLAGGMVLVNGKGKSLLELNTAVSQPQISSNIITDFLFHNGQLTLVYDVNVVDFVNINSRTLRSLRLSDYEKKEYNAFGKKIKQALDGAIYVSTEGDGLFLLREEQIVKHFSSEKSLLTSRIITDVEIVNDSLLFVGSDGDGLEILNLNTGSVTKYKTKYVSHGAISSNAVYSLFYDDGIIWVGTYQAGLNYARVESDQVVNVLDLNEKNAYYTNNSVLSICKAKDGSFWLGTDGAGLKRITKSGRIIGEYLVDSKDSALHSNVVKSIFTDSKGNVWLGFYARGIQLLGNSSAQYKNIIEYLSKQSVWCINEDTEGNLWFGILNDGLVKYQPSTKKIAHYREDVNNASSLVNNQSMCLLKGRKGDMWVGTDGGGVCVYKSAKQSFETVDLGGESSLIINDLLQYPDGSIWIADSKNGLFVLDTVTMHVKSHIDSKDILPSNRVFSLELSADSSVWIGLQKHVCRINGDSVRIYNANNGLKISNFNAFSLLVNEETVFAGGTNGLAVIDTRRKEANRRIPAVSFVDMHIDGKPVKPNRPIYGVTVCRKPVYAVDSVVIPKGTESFVLSLVCRNGLLLSNCKLRCRLKGFEKSWNYYNSNSNDLKFNNVPGGEFRLVVEYLNGEDWNEIKQLYIKKNLLLTERMSFRISLLLLIIVVFVATIYTVFRVKERQRLKLELTVRERTKEVLVQQESLLTKQQELERFNRQVSEQKASLEHQKKDLILSHSKIEKANVELKEQSVYLRELNEEMELQKNKIFDQAQILKSKNDMLTKSLNYARRIQNTLFPSEVNLKNTIPNSFLFFSPKEIVSGDFYWLRVVDNTTLLAVVDCTGHGVPGAFMSMIGNALLNEIIVNRKVLEPEKILYSLNEELIRIFNIGDFDMEAQDDGMDITVCSITDSELKVASAMQNFYLYQNDSIKVYNGDIFSIGGLMAKFKSPVYTSYTFKIEKGMALFLCSDGIVDQFGGVEREKFGVERLVSLLHKTVLHPAESRHKVISGGFADWLGENEQMDDVILVGVQF